MPTGILPIDKAPGMTSHDVVGRVRRAFLQQKVKVGHAGTLDPDATGLLLVCVGSATRLADLLAERGKVYQAGFMLGVTTSSEDSSGAILIETDSSHVTESMVQETLQLLTGEIDQIPPMVSALHHEGKRLYDLARQGIVVERAARRITVDNIKLTQLTQGHHTTGEIIVECGKGTYVRTLCADLGAKLGVGGHMTQLRRLKIGDFDVENALAVDEITLESILSHTVSAAKAVDFLPSYEISDADVVDILYGRSIPATAFYADSLVRLLDTAGKLIALAQFDNGSLHPKKVLVD